MDRTLRKERVLVLFYSNRAPPRLCAPAEDNAVLTSARCARSRSAYRARTDRSETAENVMTSCSARSWRFLRRPVCGTRRKIGPCGLRGNALDLPSLLATHRSSHITASTQPHSPRFEFRVHKALFCFRSFFSAYTAEQHRTSMTIAEKPRNGQGIPVQISTY